MNQPQASDIEETDPTDDQSSTPQCGENLQLADGGRSEAMARLREKFLFSG
jgi:hypothetical protein